MDAVWPISYFKNDLVYKSDRKSIPKLRVLEQMRNWNEISLSDKAKAVQFYLLAAGSAFDI
jgi:hypothetical protein